MLIAAITDTHENHPLIEKAKSSLKAKGCQRVIFMGDFIAPPALRRLGDVGLPIDAVYGNNDGERYGLLLSSQKYPGFTIHGEYVELTIDSRKIFLTHYPIYARHAAMTGLYDAVFYGHEHGAAKVETIGKTLLVHPGTLMSTTAPMSYGVYNTTSNTIEIITLSEAIKV